MKKSSYNNFLIIVLIIGLILSFSLPVKGQKTSQSENNDFYDNVPFKSLPLNNLEITGEVARPGLVDLSQLPLHQVQAREAKADGNQAAFIGAYVYQGYSLFDILKDQILDKRNKKEFSSPIDLMVIVENKQGERAIFSWGEIFYPNVLHRIIIAARVAPIISSTTGETWPLPEESKVVAANDLYAERNLQNPVRIIVRSFPYSEPVIKGKVPLFSANIKLTSNGKELTLIEKLPPHLTILEMPTVFFGRGRGFHGIKTFTGVSLRKILSQHFNIDREVLKKGYLVLVGADGYRAVYSASEIFNRNDFQEVLLYDQGNKDGGRLAVFAPMDFFSDRAVKAIKEIILRDGSNL